MVVGSTFKSWSDFRAWYTEAVRGFTEPDDEVRRLAAELTKGKTTREQKLEALFNFVADDIRYVNYLAAERHDEEVSVATMADGERAGCFGIGSCAAGDCKDIGTAGWW